MQPYGPQGPITNTPAIPNEYFDNQFLVDETLPEGLPRHPSTSPDLTRPIDRMMEAWGSSNNYLLFTILEGSLNSAKGAIESFISPMAAQDFQDFAQTAVQNNDESAFDQAMAPLRSVSPQAQRQNARCAHIFARSLGCSHMSMRRTWSLASTALPPTFTRH